MLLRIEVPLMLGPAVSVTAPQLTLLMFWLALALARTTKRIRLLVAGTV
jgi:hypothetical protein